MGLARGWGGRFLFHGDRVSVLQDDDDKSYGDRGLYNGVNVLNVTELDTKIIKIINLMLHVFYN